MIRRIACLFLVTLVVLTAAKAEPVSRREVLAAIAVLDRDVTSKEAVDAATVVARFGKESDAVLITVGAETLPWVQTDAPEGEAKVRALLMAAYFAGDIKSQLEKRRPADDPYRGWLISKLDNSGKGPGYTHTPAGRLSGRTWARGVVTTNSYNAAGDLWTVSYSDGTPGVTNLYDRVDRLVTNFCNGITTARTYDPAHDPLGESYSGGVLGGLAVTNFYDGLLRRSTLSVVKGSSSVASTLHGYDAASRLLTVSDGVNCATYSYLDPSSTVAKTEPWIINDLQRRQNLLALHFRFLHSFHSFSRRVGGRATPAARHALCASPNPWLRNTKRSLVSHPCRN